MGHWNHRVVRRTVMEFDQPVEWFGIHEVFYGSSDESDPGWTDEPISVEGESIDELRETLERMLRALDRPVIIDNEKEQGFNA
jgi:hypothetical protein